MLSLYKTLWIRSGAEGVPVTYAGETPNGEDGWFQVYFDESEGVECGSIHMVRPFYGDPRTPSATRSAAAPADLAPPDILAELCTLAHEYGHAVSWRAGNRTAEYVAATDRMFKLLDAAAGGRLTDEECSLIEAEERRAWANGRAMLGELGFADWAVFDERERAGLAEYVRIFSGDVFAATTE